ANRRARVAGAPGATSPAEWQAILARFGRCCAYCGSDEPRLHRDHVVALAAGGSNWPANLVPACRSCNSRKGTKPLAEFYAACVAAGTADLWNPELISRLNENGRKAA
ncbi:MAG: HNH endonuclease, partial [Terriglobia bacterium]